MKKLLAISLAMVMVLGAASYVFAGANPMVQLAIDAQARNAKRACVTSLYGACSEIVSEYHGIGYTDVIIVVYRYNVITAVEYGLTFPGAYMTAFVNCADFIVGGVDLGGYMSCAQSWIVAQYAANPDPGTSGIAVGWMQLYTYGPMRVDIVPSFDQQNLQVLDAQLAADVIHTVHAGFLGSEAPGGEDLEPCTPGPTAAEASTWGSVKSLYR